MKIFKDVATATGQTLWRAACKIGQAVDGYGQEHYYGDHFLQMGRQQTLIEADRQQDTNDDNLTEPSSPKLVADMSEFDPDLALDLNETSWSGSFFALDLVFNGLINLTIEYVGFDANDIPLIQDDIVYYG